MCLKSIDAIFKMWYNVLVTLLKVLNFQSKRTDTTDKYYMASSILTSSYSYLVTWMYFMASCNTFSVGILCQVVCVRYD